VILTDVNVLVYAYRTDAPQHQAYRDWLEQAVNGDEAYGLSDLVLSGFVRVVTHPRVFAPPSPIEDALQFANVLRDRPDCVRIAPGPRHWSIFVRLCRDAGVRGNLVPDAYLAALAIESGSEWITTDRDYSRFPGLRWRHPLAAG
jgi:toxin-antitoxin system PIN domain toxin